MQDISQSLSVKEAVESRRSVRRYEPGSITKEELNELFRLTRLAPSAWNVQAWRFHVVMDENKRQQLQEAAYGQKQITSAPAVILVTSDMEDVVENLMETVHPGMPPERREQEVANLSAFFNGMTVEERGQWGLTQTGIALGILLITAQGMGLSTVPMLGFDQAKVREILGLPEHVRFAAMVPIGRGAEPGFEHHRHSVERIAKYY